MAGSIKLAPLLTEIKVDIENFKNDMEKASAIGTSEAKRISKVMETTAKVGKNFSKAGDLLTKGLTLPIVGVGAATTKMAVDFESSFVKVSTLLDSNVVDFAQYKNELLDASSETKVAVDEFSEAVYSSISAGVDQKEAIQFTTDAMKLAKGGFTDGAKAVDVLTTAINAYGLEASDATRVSDLLITTQNLGKTTVDELASSMGTVIPVANASNFSIEELSASYAQLTKNGVATAESGTYLKAMLSELSKSGSIADITLRDLTGKGFADLKKEGTSTTEILSLLNVEAQKNDKTLKDMFGSVEAGSAALVLYKNNGEEYNEMLRGMETSAGATQKAFEKIDATPAEQLKGALNELRNEGVHFGAAFVPVIEKASDILGDAAEAFSELTDEQKENVVQWGITLAAAGPALKLIGGGIQTYTKLKTGIGAVTKALSAFGDAQEAAGIGGSVLAKSFTGALGTCAPLAAGLAAVGAGVYALHEQSDVLNSTVLKSREEMSWLEEALADLQGVTRYTKDELEEMGYVHKEFSDELSPEFQEAVEESTKKVQEFSVYLHEIGFDGIMTQEETDGFTKRVNGICDEVISTIENRKEEAQSGLKDLFIADDQVIDESEQKVLELLSQSSDAQISEVQTLQGEILAIQQNAANEKRQLNEQEIADILNNFHSIVVKDIINHKPGRLYIGDQYLSCYISGDIKTDAFMGVPIQVKNLTVVTDHPFWIHEVSRSFQQIISGDDPEGHLDYEYDFNYDYTMPYGSDLIWTVDHFAPCEFLLTVFGPVTDPMILINGHPYQVYTSLDENDYMQINSRNNTIVKYRSDGVRQDIYDSRAKQQSVFDLIAPGNIRVVWPGSFGFDLKLYCERSEPKCKTKGG